MVLARRYAIPLSRRQIIDALAERFHDGEERGAFIALGQVLAAFIHHKLHERLETMKESYAPINPDLDRTGSAPVKETELTRAADRVGQSLSEVLRKGNYRRLTKEDIEGALLDKAIFPLTLSVDFDAYDELVIYARGETPHALTMSSWFGLKKTSIDIPTYDRICMFLRFKPEATLTPRQRRELGGEPGRTLLKLFRNIPKADLEMLLPNLQMRMRAKDKLMLGVPAVLGGVPVFVKLVPALAALSIMSGMQDGEINEASIIAGLTGLLGLVLFSFAQWDKWRSRKMLFMKMLAENLYFRNIDNDEGVLTRLIDEAEEEECKEVLVAYALLFHSKGLDRNALAAAVDDWLSSRFSVRVEFEIDDAMGKLVGLDLAERKGELYEAVPLDRARAALERHWDALCHYK